MGGPWGAKVPLLATHSIGPFSSYQWGKSPGWAGKAPAGPLVPTSKGLEAMAVVGWRFWAKMKYSFGPLCKGSRWLRLWTHLAAHFLQLGFYS
jgi:hypothetical protein